MSDLLKEFLSESTATELLETKEKTDTSMDKEIDSEDDDHVDPEALSGKDSMEDEDEVITEVEDEDDMDAMEEAALEKYAMALNQMGDEETLTEQKNIVRLNRQSRLLNMTNRTAIVMARKSNDNLYKKYAKFNALRLQYRAQIVKKYGSKAASYARKLLSRSAPPSK